jgi:hypothetical protein
VKTLNHQEQHLTLDMLTLVMAHAERGGEREHTCKTGGLQTFPYHLGDMHNLASKILEDTTLKT